MQQILIVEDDHNLRVLLRQALEDKGYSVLSATNGHDALAILQQSRSLPCLILLDSMMPLMTGWEFIREKIRSPVLADIPTLVMSANQAIDVFLQAQSDAFIQKPFEIDALLELIARYTSHGKLTAHLQKA